MPSGDLGCHAPRVPTLLPLARHLEGLRGAMVAFVRYADRAGQAAPVPTCPGWTVRDLVEHQGDSHRTAAALLRGEEPVRARIGGAEPVEWLRDGVIELVEAITRAPGDVRAPVFLDDAPAPREFWARRACHQTTLHAVDALAASLGRCPDPRETWIEADLAVDGIDELLGGFLAQPRSRMRCAEDAVLVVAPDDAPDSWLVLLGPGPAVTHRLSGRRLDVPSADWELGGHAVDLYLALWDRGPATSVA